MKILLIFIIIITLLTGCTNNTNEQINYQTKEIHEPQKISGSFSTKITDKTPERLNNIKLGIKKLNGATIKTNEEFSFNTQIGPRTPENGFEKAIIFDGHGNKMEGYGGGVCQISSTLYNAVLSAGFPVTERHEHSRNVPYIEKGKDAAVSYDSEDLKFINTSKSILKIMANINNDTLTVTIEPI